MKSSLKSTAKIRTGKFSFETDVTDDMVLLMMVSPGGLDSVNHSSCVCVCAATSSCRSRGKAIIWTWSRPTPCSTSPCWKWAKHRNTRPSRNPIMTTHLLKDSSMVNQMTNVVFHLLFYHQIVIPSLVAHPHVLTQSYSVTVDFCTYLFFCPFWSTT